MTDEMNRTVFTQRLRSMAFTPDGEYLAAALGVSIHIWDSRSGKVVQFLSGHHTSWINYMLVTPDGQRILSCSETELVLWDRKTGQPVWIVKGDVGQIALMPDGKTFVRVECNEISSYDLDTGKYLSPLVQRQEKRIFPMPIAASSDGSRIAFTIGGGKIGFCDLRAGGEIIGLPGHSSLVRAMAFTPDGRTLVSAGLDHNLRLWDLDVQQCVGVLEGHKGLIEALAITPDGKTVVSGSADKTIRFWDLQSEKQQQVLQGNLPGIFVLAISPDGHTLASSGFNSDIIFWDLRSCRPERTLKGLKRSVVCVDHSAEELLVGRTDDDGQVIHLRRFTPDGKCSYQKIQLIERCMNAGVAISPDHKLVAAGGLRKMFLFDIASGQFLRSFDRYSDFHTELKFSPDGCWLQSRYFGGYRSWCVWDVQTGELMMRGMDFGEGTTHVDGDLSAGKTSYLHGVDGISMLDMDSIQHLHDVLEDNKWHEFVALAVHPGAKTFVTGIWNEGIREWDLETGEHLRTFESGQMLVSSLAFSRDGRLLISGSERGGVDFWEYETGRPLATAHLVDEGYLWTTPPDEFAGNGWLYTDRPDLISLIESNPNGGDPEYIREDDERFSEYMRIYNDGEMVMNRINDWEHYRELLRFQMDSGGQVEFAQIETGVKTDRLFQISSGDLPLEKNVEL